MEVIFFEEKEALEKFKLSEFALSAQASTVAAAVAPGTSCPHSGKASSMQP